MKPKIMNNLVIATILIVSATFGGFLYVAYQQENIEDTPFTYATTIGRDFYILENNQSKQLFVKGVNLGATKPLYFPGELAITKEEYLRWFGYIGQMNANTIRVYTAMMPCFYEALFEFNQTAPNPLYLMQGVWLNEEHIKETKDAFANNQFLLESLANDASDLVDIFHGNKTIPQSPGRAYGSYSVDIARYVIGWIIGIEWDPEFVMTTNLNNPNRTHYTSAYLHTNNASPFEVFLAEVGSRTLSYEADNYNMTRPLSFVNWLTTDHLTHTNEPRSLEDIVSVDLEHIQLSPKAAGGIFASYHIYPYYPEFMNYQPEYAQYIDDDGKYNPYKAYLIDLYASHNMPVLVAEFGIPSSRGKAHDAIISGMNQGNMTEIEQGEMVASMLEDIVEVGLMGALIFAWQDEWFKRTWNTMDYDLDWRRPFWSNVETNEQAFGLLAFDPGVEAMIVHTDQDDSEWAAYPSLGLEDNIRLKACSDARYLYLYIDYESLDFDEQRLIVAINTLDQQGNSQWLDQNVSFDLPTEFMLVFDQATSGSLYVDNYYDPFMKLYGDSYNTTSIGHPLPVNNSGRFNITRHVLSSQLYLPELDISVPFSSYASGILQAGNSNPNALDYNSLADFNFGDGFVEIRIPWLLLNVMDPSTKQIMGPIQGTTFPSMTSQGFDIGVGIQTSQEDLHITLNRYYDWDEWHTLIYHERLKQSYFIIQEAFAHID